MDTFATLRAHTHKYTIEISWILFHLSCSFQLKEQLFNPLSLNEHNDDDDDVGVGGVSDASGGCNGGNVSTAEQCSRQQ